VQSPLHAHNAVPALLTQYTACTVSTN